MDWIPDASSFVQSAIITCMLKAPAAVSKLIIPCHVMDAY